MATPFQTDCSKVLVHWPCDTSAPLWPIKELLTYPNTFVALFCCSLCFPRCNFPYPWLILWLHLLQINSPLLLWKVNKVTPQKRRCVHRNAYVVLSLMLTVCILSLLVVVWAFALFVCRIWLKSKRRSQLAYIPMMKLHVWKSGIRMWILDKPFDLC